MLDIIKYDIVLFFLLKISRESIDVMKQYFREDMTKTDWQLIVELKKILDIM